MSAIGLHETERTAPPLRSLVLGHFPLFARTLLTVTGEGNWLHAGGVHVPKQIALAKRHAPRTSADSFAFAELAILLQVTIAVAYVGQCDYSDAARVHKSLRGMETRCRNVPHFGTRGPAFVKVRAKLFNFLLPRCT